MKLSRRKFIHASTQAGAALVVIPTGFSVFAGAAHSELSGLQFQQEKLGYGYDALEPHIDATTMNIHYNKHHAAYVKNVNDAIAEEKITVVTEKDFFSNVSKLSTKARNNGGGAWNHNFFWSVMGPAKGKAPGGKVAEALSGSFGSVDSFKEQFKEEATGRFGSGWAWLVKDGNKLKVGSTPNQDNPLMDISDFKGQPILALDVWEHAYYLKYQNKRAEYIDNWWNVVNWDKVAAQL